MTTPTIGSLEKRLERLERNQADSDKVEDTGPDGGLDLVSSRGYIAIHRDHNERYHLTSPRLRRGLSDSIRILDPADLRTLADAIEKDRDSRTGRESEADEAQRDFIQRSKERLRR